MTEQTAGAETPVADATPVVEAPVASPESTPEQPTTETVAEQPEADGDNAAAASRKKPGVHNRIDELTRQKHEALREAEYWRTKAQEAASTNLDTLDYDDQLIAKVRISERQEKADAAERTAQQVVERQFLELEADARARWPDYDAVARNPSLLIPDALAELIVESEIGPDLAYHLGKNPNEAARLARLSGKSLAKEIGKLEARLSQPSSAPKVPSAPVRPVSGIAAGGTKDPGSMSMAEYAAWRKANP